MKIHEYYMWAVTPRPSPAGCRYRILVTPEARFRWRRRSGSLLEKTSVYIGFLLPRGKYRPKEGPRGVPSHPSGQGARAPVAMSLGCLGVVASPRSALLAPGVFRGIRILVTFWNFLSTFIFGLFLQCNNKTDRNWHWALD